MSITTLEIKIDQADLAKVHLLMADVKNGVPKVMVRAINKTLDGVQTDAVKFIAVDLNLTQARIREDFYINRASWDYIAGSVVAKGRPVNLASLQGTTENRSDYNGGISVKIKKSGARVRLKHAFLWSRPSGAVSMNPISGGLSQDTSATAFEREWHDYHTFRSVNSPWKKFGPKYRLPLERKTGPRIEDEFAKDRVLKSVEIEAKGRIDANMAHELDYELSRLK